METLLKKQVLAFELHKNQSYVDRLLKEGEIIGIKSILESIKDDKIKELAESKLNKLNDELIELKAIEKVFLKLDQDIENSLNSMDILNELKENREHSKDVLARLNENKCCMKKPGILKFPCNNEIVKGSKYCLEHLQKYDKVLYTHLVSNNEKK